VYGSLAKCGVLCVASSVHFFLAKVLAMRVFQAETSFPPLCRKWKCTILLAFQVRCQSHSDKIHTFTQVARVFFCSVEQACRVESAHPDTPRVSVSHVGSRRHPTTVLPAHSAVLWKSICSSVAIMARPHSVAAP